MTPAASKLACLHCRSPIPTAAESSQFCCAGCETVYGLLKRGGLERYYALAGDEVLPVAPAPGTRNHAWLEPLVACAGPPGEVGALTLDVQGVHCAACVWLMNETFRRQPGAGSIIVNPALGQVSLRFRQGTFDVQGWVRGVEDFGYQFGPARKKSVAGSQALTLRLGVCAALTINVMLFSVSFYLGLSPSDPDIFHLFTLLSFALSSLVVAVGGWPFFRSALQGLKRGLLHLDLPIALGIALVYATSLAQLPQGRGDLFFLDTLNTFITLMLLGRWLQQGALGQSRAFLLEDDGAATFTVRRRVGQGLESVPAAAVRRGDELLIAPGELVPVDAALGDRPARVSTDWITGESDPREVPALGPVPAGAFNVGQSAFTAVASTDFRDSPLVLLLRSTAQAERADSGAFFSRLSKAWVAAVLAIAAFAFWVWLPEGLEKAVNVAAGLLVVTCPCAIGIALPLAYELAHARLRRLGFFVRRGDALDSLARVRTIFFDKTGTLTLNRLELDDAGAVEGLEAEALEVAYNLACRSNHPASVCLTRALERRGPRFEPGAEVVEEPGRGLSWTREGVAWRLGAPAWAVESQPLPGGPSSVVLSRQGRAVQAFGLREAARADAQDELRALAAEGRALYLASGDARPRVEALAARLGLAPAVAHAELRPEDKAALVRSIDPSRALYLGDGVNDALAFDAALVAGTPAIDRPVMPGKSDFFMLGEGLSALRAALHEAKHLRQHVWLLLALATGYNLLAVSTGLLGELSPLRAAVGMPLSSLSLVGLTAWAFRGARSTPRPQAAGRPLAPTLQGAPT